MARTVLPQNLILDEGTLIEGFESAADWTPTNGTAEDETTLIKSGPQAIKFSATTAGTSAIFVKTIALDFRSMHNLSFWFYTPPSATSTTDLDRVGLWLSSVANLAKRYAAPNFYTSVMARTGGWHLVRFRKSDFTNTGGESWDNLMIRLQISVTPMAGKTAYAIIDDLRINVRSLPMVIFMWDDGFFSAYDKAFTYMTSRGIPFNVAVIASYIDTVGCLTLAQLQTIYDSGADLLLHAVPNFATLTDSEIAAELAGCRALFDANGFTRGRNFLVYPQGGHSASTDALVAAHGVQAARCGDIDGNNMPISNIMGVKGYELKNTTTLAEAKAWIDKAYDLGQTCIIFGHKVADAPGDVYTVATSVVQGLVDYIVERRMRTPTFSEWYNQLSHPRKVVSRA